MSPQIVHQIAVIPGDGTGPEVVAEGLKVLKAVSELNEFSYKIKELVELRIGLILNSLWNL